MRRETRIRRRLLAWFDRHQRRLPWRESVNPYEIWVSEVMLQQTRVDTVIPYYKSFLRRFPDVRALARAGDEEVLKAWEGLGYYARARNLHRAAREVVERYGAEVPSDPAAFRELSGVGEYVCSAVCSIAWSRPLAAVDGNVRRVLARLHALETPVNHPSGARVFQEHADRLLERSRPGDFNQAMMELGAVVCRPRVPRCADCPLSAECDAFASRRTGELPRRVPRRAVPSYRVAVGVVEEDGRVLITRRPPEGLLGGLWEFPGGKIRDGESAQSACVREIREEVNLEVEVEGHVGRVRHAYTHFRVELDVFRCRRKAGQVSLSGPVDHRWITLEEVDDYAFPRANHKFIPLLRDPADD
jgi:A/G-specific adenine glycosylase